jgi:dephospho-CoA kinase
MEINEIPTLSNITKAKITKNRNANFATKLFDSRKSLVPEVPLLVENELKAPLSLIIYIK